jgi:hypothetical protein
MRSKTFVVATLLLFGIQPLSAQDSPLEPGARVRLQVCDPHSTLFTRRGAASVCTARMEGTFVAVSRDTFLLQAEAGTDPSAIPFASVTELEVSQGRHRSSSRAIGFGLLGLVGGSMVGCVAVYNISTYEGDDKDLECAFGGVIGGVVGGVVGAIIGASNRERWAEVPLDRLRLQVAPQPSGRFGFGASIRF